MGNAFAPPAAPLPPALVLEEERDVRGLLMQQFNRLQAGNPELRRMLARSGPAGALCTTLRGGADGAGGCTRDGFNALHVACVVGWANLVECLLEAGVVQLDAPSREGYTPLMLAAGCGHAPIAATLLARGASLGARSSRGASPIAFAAAGGAATLGALRRLLAHATCTPALVRQLGYRSCSPLVMAVINHGHAPTIQALLEHGADPSETCMAADMAGVSVLHSCAHLARVDAMRCLIAAGAQVNAASEDGVSVLQECFVQPPTRQRSEAAKRRMFSMLVAAGADVNASTTLPDLEEEREYTVLHFALASCREEATATLLLESGIDLGKAINGPVGLGDGAARQTLLHLAAMRGFSRMAERLVEAGADMQARNKDGLTPLHAAVLGCHAGTVAVLLAKGADPLALGPDCYPSFAQWRLRRGMQHMQAHINAFFEQHGVEAWHPEDEPSAQLSAVDLACCVARHIPTVEAFVERGVHPSPAALALAEQAVPLMRAVVERPFLTPQLAARLPPRFRAAARELLLCLRRPTRTRDGGSVTLAPDAVATVLQHAAFPVSRWAGPAWLAAQQTQGPPPRVQPAGQQPGPGGQPGAGGGPPPPGIHILGPGEEVPPFLQQVMAEVAAQLGAAGALPQFMGGQQPHPGQQAGAGAGAAAGAAAGGGAGAAAGAPGGGPGGGAQLPQGAGAQVHIMQFQIPLDGLPGMGPPQNLAGGMMFPLGGLPGMVPPPPQQPQQAGQAAPLPFALGGMPHMQMHIHVGGPLGMPFGGLPGAPPGAHPADFDGAGMPPFLQALLNGELEFGDGDDDDDDEEEEPEAGGAPFGGPPFGMPPFGMPPIFFGGPPGLAALAAMSDSEGEEDEDEEEDDDEYVDAEEEPPAGEPPAPPAAAPAAQAGAPPPAAAAAPFAGAGPSTAAAAAVAAAAHAAAGQPGEAGPSDEGRKHYHLRERAPKRQRRE